MLSYMGFRLNWPYVHRRKLYYDHGSATLDAWYRPNKLRVNSLLRVQRYDSAA